MKEKLAECGFIDMTNSTKTTQVKAKSTRSLDDLAFALVVLSVLLLVFSSNGTV